MARRKRQATTFNLSFLDIMSCGFGAVVLVFLIIDHSIEVQIQSVNAETLSEIALLDEDIREGQAGLVRLRNAIDSADLEIVEANGLATRVTEELSEYEALIAALEEQDVAESANVDALKAEINRLEEQVDALRAAADAESGRSAREFTGDGNRQYLTGLNLGGSRIAILFDISASMLHEEIVNVIQLRVREPAVQREAEKWLRALDTVDWLTAQLPIGARYQVITFNTEANFAVADSAGRWLEVADNEGLQEVTDTLRAITPSEGTSLYHAFRKLGELPSPPDNIFLITDGLPTRGESRPRGTTINGRDRLRLFRAAVRQLPAGVPVNIILAPMEGDPMAASEFWQLAQVTRGSFMSPAQDWP